MNARQLALTALIVFVAAFAGVLIGRHFIPAAPAETTELHDVLHRQLALDPEQDRKIHALEAGFADRRRALEAAMRAENARLAQAIAAEHEIGPQVSAAVDASHRTMGDLQKETLSHIFAMRRLLHPDQTARFDAEVTKALTEDAR